MWEENTEESLHRVPEAFSKIYLWVPYAERRQAMLLKIASVREVVLGAPLRSILKNLASRTVASDHDRLVSLVHRPNESFFIVPHVWLPLLISHKLHGMIAQEMKNVHYGLVILAGWQGHLCVSHEIQRPCWYCFGYIILTSNYSLNKFSFDFLLFSWLTSRIFFRNLFKQDELLD